MNGVWLLLLVLLPAAGGLAVFRMGDGRLRRRFMTILLAVEAVAFAVVSFLPLDAFHVASLGGGLEVTLRCDGIGRLFGVTVCFLWLAVGIYAADYMETEENRPRFFCFYLLTEAALVGICLADNMVTLYLFYELMTVLSLPMVIHDQTKEAISAGVKYLCFSIIGAGLGLFGLFYLHRFGGTLAFQAGGMLSAAAGGQRTMLLILYLLMMIGFGVKAGMFPLFTWLPTAHPVAPSPASAVLSGLITKMGVLAILRLNWFVFGPDLIRGTWVQRVVLILAIFTIFAGSMLAFLEKVLKRRLAYSTVSQVSYALLGIFLLDSAGLEGALYQFLFHALAKDTLFLAAGAMILATGCTRVDEFRGIGRRAPAVLWGFTLGALSLIGIPPTGGFLSKWYLAQGTLESGLGPLAWVGLAVLMVSALLTAGYLLPMVISGFFPGEGYEPPELQRPISRRMSGVVLVLGILLVVLGLFPGLLSGLMQPAMVPGA